jgi:hypothetical protein
LSNRFELSSSSSSCSAPYFLPPVLLMSRVLLLLLMYALTPLRAFFDRTLSNRYVFEVSLIFRQKTRVPSMDLRSRLLGPLHSLTQCRSARCGSSCAGISRVCFRRPWSTLIHPCPSRTYPKLKQQDDGVLLRVVRGELSRIRTSVHIVGSGNASLACACSSCDVSSR